MFRRTPSPRPALAALAGLAGLALLTAGVPAEAAPAGTAGATAPAAPLALEASGPFSAVADASLLTLDLQSLSPALLPQTNVDLAHSTAGADSAGDLDTTKPNAQRTAAVAGTTGDTSVLGAPVSIQENVASAPASEANEDVLIPLDLSPLLNLPVIRTTALANWVSDTECVASDVPLSLADQSLADLELLGIADGQSVVALDTDDADGAADTEAATYLAEIEGAGDLRAVQARTTTTISSANVLNGLAGPGSLIQLDVVQAPDWTVSASGLPGGASVTGEQPVVNVSLGGDPIITLDAADETVESTITDLVLGDLLGLDGAALLPDLLADLGLDALIPVVTPVEDLVQTALREVQPVVRVSMPLDIVEAADGTNASVEGALLRVELLAPEILGATQPVADIVNQLLGALGADITQPLLTLDVAPVSAEVNAPAGGIDCGGEDDDPLRELNKHASALEVAPGGVFDYNIAVPNRGPCVVTDVVVTDVISGPAGFEVIGTEPSAASVDGGTITWNLGDLEVNETVNLTITVRVPADAADGDTFDDDVQVTGNCDGVPVEETDDLDDIPTVRDDFSGPCNVGFSNKDASHIEVFPGQTFSYYVHAFNSGAEDCTDVDIVDTLDDRLSFVSCNRGCTNAGQEVTWNLDTLPGGSSAVLSVVVQVDGDADGTLANTALISPSNGPEKRVDTTGPEITDRSLPKDPQSPGRGPTGPLPRTGLPIATSLAAVLGAGALALFAVRRRVTA